MDETSASLRCREAVSCALMCFLESVDVGLETPYIPNMLRGPWPVVSVIWRRRPDTSVSTRVMAAEI